MFKNVWITLAEESSANTGNRFIYVSFAAQTKTLTDEKKKTFDGQTDREDEKANQDLKDQTSDVWTLPRQETEKMGGAHS